MKLLPVILAGGSGSRLWPLSRTHYPKQFLSLTNDASLLQETILRLQGIAHQPVSLVCNEEHRFLVAEQIRAASLKHSAIFLEPFGRNTAPAAAIAALQAIENDEDPLLLILPADHLIQNEKAFCDAIMQAKNYAKQGKLVTFGITVNSPETGYGYIRRGRALECGGYEVDSFIEKPDYQTASTYLAEGNYYWNSGMFLFKASTYLRELKEYRPDIFCAAQASFTTATKDLDFIRLGKEEFRLCPNESIDYAVMEKTDSAVVLPFNAGWNDIGSWSSLWEISNKDGNNNVIQGDVLAENSHHCYINSQERLIAAVGVEDLVIVDTKDALLVAHRDKVQSIKNIVADLKANKRSEFECHREIYRLWGKHDQIADGERYHVKKVVVKPGKKTAMQLHYHRAEHWIIVSGTAKVYRGDETHIITENESIYIPVGIAHCFENPGKFPLEIIEVRTGSYLAEDDIVRTDSQDNKY